MLYKIQIIKHIILLAVLGCLNAVPTPIDSKPQPTNPEETANLFEGDMKFPQGVSRGVLLRGNNVRWPGGIVPYEFSSDPATTHQLTERTTIETAMRRMELLLAVNNVQCIRFRPREPSDQYYIIITNGNGCWSYVGQNTGSVMNRTVSLQHPGCVYEGIVMHELIHTLGFFHEQSRPDRDNFIYVNYSNIQGGKEGNFDKYTVSYVDTQGTPYDYGSVMHYSSTSFSSNGLPTIVPLQSNVTIGQRTNMSAIDIQEVRLFYGCNGTGATLPPTTTAPTIISTYSLQLSSSSSSYVRNGASSGIFYFAAYQLTSTANAVFTIDSDSTIDTYGYVYSAFNPASPSSNLITSNDDGANNSQFRVVTAIQASQTVILVVTTFYPGSIGPITLRASGPSTVTFTPIIYGGGSNTTTATTAAPTTSRLTTTTTIKSVTTQYSHQLSSASPKFTRPGGSSANYSYQSIRVTVSVGGNYTFFSNSTFDTYGILYNNSFTATNPTFGLLVADDDSAGNYQFRLVRILTAGVRYILVCTTYAINTVGPFMIIGTGPGSITYTRLTT